MRLTPRASGYSLEHIIERLNPVIRGWYEYFKHAHWNVFETFDGRIRKRLRAMLRKRQNISGYTNNKDHVRWPNAYFIAKGLFTMSRVRKRELRVLRKG